MPRRVPMVYNGVQLPRRVPMVYKRASVGALLFVLSARACPVLECSLGGGLAELCCPAACPLVPRDYTASWMGPEQPGLLCGDHAPQATRARQQHLAPQVFILGSGKAGTSTLWHLLLTNSERRLEMARYLFSGDGDEEYHRKELSFFGTARFSRGVKWYFRHFSKCPRRAAASMDASPGYLHSEVAPLQLKAAYHPRTHGRLRFIVMLRDPIGKLASWHDFLVHLGGGSSSGSFVRPFTRGAKQQSNASAEACAGAYRTGAPGAWPGDCGGYFACLGARGLAQALLSDPARARRYFDADAVGLDNWASAFGGGGKQQFLVASLEELSVGNGTVLASRALAWLNQGLGLGLRGHFGEASSNHPGGAGGGGGGSPAAARGGGGWGGARGGARGGEAANAGAGDPLQRAASSGLSGEALASLARAALPGLGRLAGVLRARGLGSRDTALHVAGWQRSYGLAVSKVSTVPS